MHVLPGCRQQKVTSKDGRPPSILQPTSIYRIGALFPTSLRMDDCIGVRLFLPSYPSSTLVTPFNPSESKHTSSSPGRTHQHPLPSRIRLGRYPMALMRPRGRRCASTEPGGQVSGSVGRFRDLDGQGCGVPHKFPSQCTLLSTPHHPTVPCTQ